MAVTVFRDKTADLLKKRLLEIYARKNPPECDKFHKLLKKVNETLSGEDPDQRPRDASGRPGGVIYLVPGITTIIVPDIHARMELVLNVLLYEDRHGHSNLDKLSLGELQVVCVGDGVHAEGRAAERWASALEEFKEDFATHEHMDEEMRESFGVMEMVMETKRAFPTSFHFLKGNHENIRNETGNGNHAYRKHAYEGAMVHGYVQKFYSEAFIEQYDDFEKSLPLLAVGNNFLISHAEPYTFFDRQQVVEYRNDPHVVECMTWTDNDMAEDGSVQRMIGHYLGEEQIGRSYYFAGHRAISGRYRYKAESGFVQLHNPNKSIIAVIKPDEKIDLDIDIIEISDRFEANRHQ